MSDNLTSDLQSLRIQRGSDPNRPSSLTRWVAVPVILVLLAAGATLAVRSFSSRVFQTEVSVTEIRSISPAQSSTLVTSTGYLVPQIEARVGSRIPGRVAEVRVREGDRVEKGDVLVVLEGEELNRSLAASQARLIAARAREGSAEASLAEISLSADREERLSVHGATARSIAEDLKARVRVLEEALKAARAESEVAAADVRQVELNRSSLVIVAPIRGVVVRKPVTVGETVGAARLDPVVDLADLTSLMVETDVPEARLSVIKGDAPAEIVLDSLPNQRFRGQVVEISPRVSRSKATAIVKVRFWEPVEGLLPDMAARVGFLSEPLQENALKEAPKIFIPGSAVVEREGKKVVFSLKEGKAQMEVVTLGPPLGEGFELLFGPPEGTRVIADPPPSIQDGYPVKEKV